MKTGNHSVTHTLQPDGKLGSQQQETVRLILQALTDMGYTSASEALSAESGVKVESVLVENFRRAILDGLWSSAETSLRSLELTNPADESEVLFLVREQKFLELMDEGDTSGALMTLRTELVTLEHNTERLHFLSSLIMAGTSEELRSQADWDGREGNSRLDLLRKISMYISPNSMIPEARLTTLLEAARQIQVDNCLYHTSEQPISFLKPNHSCPRTAFPLHTAHILHDHEDEVWHVQYSSTGQFLASAGASGLIVIYDTRTMLPLHHLNRRSPEEIKKDKKDGKLKGVSYLAFKDDDSLLMTCSQDNVIVHWDLATGTIMNQISISHAQSVSSVCWLPQDPAGGFVSGGLDKKIILYDDKGSSIHVWDTERIYDVKVTNDGKYVIGISTESGVYIFDLKTKERVALLNIQFELTSLNISHDSKRLIISCSPTTPKGRSAPPKSLAMEIQERSIPDLQLLRRVTGQKQGEFVIRSCYAGHKQQFILSGSEDCYVYLWHRKSSTLLERIPGHTKTVGAVAWHPQLDQWASASDDKTVRIWDVEREVDAGTRDAPT